MSEPTDQDIDAAIDAAAVFWSAAPVRAAIAGEASSGLARSIYAHAQALARLRVIEDAAAVIQRGGRSQFEKPFRP